MAEQRVLLAEDHRDIRTLLAMTLDRGGYDVHQFQDGEAALAALADVDPDALVTDLTMPGLDGFELISESRRLPGYELLPTLVLTALDTGSERLDALRQLPRLTILQKPPNWSDLVPELQRLIES